jgi:hypothetical protein
VTGLKKSPSPNFSVVVIFWSFYIIESIYILFLNDADKISIWHFTQAPFKDRIKLTFQFSQTVLYALMAFHRLIFSRQN